jgi:hypothetical protein
VVILATICKNRHVGDRQGAKLPPLRVSNARDSIDWAAVATRTAKGRIWMKEDRQQSACSNAQQDRYHHLVEERLSSHAMSMIERMPLLEIRSFSKLSKVSETTNW